MRFTNHQPALIRGLLAGAVVLASATACSRPDRAETGNNNTGTITADTAFEGRNDAVTLPSADTMSAMADTMSAMNADTTSAAAPAPAPRSATATPRPETGANRDTATAGYSGMERDTGGVEAPRDTARLTTDSTAASSEQSSVTPSDSAPLEVATPTTGDTSVSTPAGEVQEDTAAVNPPGETPAAAVVGDSTVEMAGPVDQGSVADSATAYPEMTRDTSTLNEQSDTEMAVTSDTTVQPDDSANVASTGDRLDPVTASAEENDTLTETEATPVRPPEDSTEVYGNVTETNAADEVGAAAITPNVNGADAVALMTRQGAQCIVMDPRSAQGVAMDMSETPATLNPCGMGSMVLTRIGTQKE